MGRRDLKSRGMLAKMAFESEGAIFDIMCAGGQNREEVEKEKAEAAEG